MASLYSVASVAGPPLMTHLFGRFSAPASGLHFPGAAFLCSAFLVVVSGVLFVTAIRRAPAATVVTEERVPAAGH